MATTACPSEADAVKGAVDTVLQRNNTEELNEEKLFREIAWGAKEMLCGVEERDESKDSKNRAEA